jgi:hypothetical protein
LEGRDNVLIEILSGDYLETEESDGKPVRIAGVRAEIRTEHLTNTSLERYRYTNVFDFLVVKDCGYMSLHTWQITQ